MPPHEKIVHHNERSYLKIFSPGVSAWKLRREYAHEIHTTHTDAPSLNLKPPGLPNLYVSTQLSLCFTFSVPRPPAPSACPLNFCCTYPYLASHIFAFLHCVVRPSALPKNTKMDTLFDRLVNLETTLDSLRTQERDRSRAVEAILGEMETINENMDRKPEARHTRSTLLLMPLFFFVKK